MLNWAFGGAMELSYPPRNYILVDGWQLFGNVTLLSRGASLEPWLHGFLRDRLAHGLDWRIMSLLSVQRSLFSQLVAQG